MSRQAWETMPPEHVKVWATYADGFEWVDYVELLADMKFHFSEPVLTWCYMTELNYVPDHYRYWDGTEEDLNEMREQWHKANNELRSMQ